MRCTAVLVLEHVGKRIWSVRGLFWSVDLVRSALPEIWPILFLCDGFMTQWHSLDTGTAKRVHDVSHDVN
jgi:hypothetical protein